MNVLLTAGSSSGPALPTWNTNTTNTSLLTGARTTSFNVVNDGTTLRNNQSTSTNTPGPNWFSPTTANIGNSYWVFASYVTTLNSGSTMTATGSFNTWLHLTGNTSWGFSTTSGASGTEWDGTLTLQFSASSGGTVLGTGTVDFAVGYTP